MSTPSSAGDAGIGLGLNWLTAAADKGMEGLGAVPVVGQAVSGIQSGYHLLAGGYDAVTGDRDGAVAHGAQALSSAAMVVPGVNGVLSGIDTTMGIAGTGARAAGEYFGVDSAIVDSIPTGIGDVNAMSAVAATNAILGAEDKTDNTGTRGGEISAGMMGMTMMMTGGNPLAMAAQGASWAMGGDPGTVIANEFGVASNPTSGTEPTLASQAGVMAHDYIADLF